jgi:hypothetical protein
MKIHHATASYLHAACRDFPSAPEPAQPSHRNSSTFTLQRLHRTTRIESKKIRDSFRRSAAVDGDNCVWRGMLYYYRESSDENHGRLSRKQVESQQQRLFGPQRQVGRLRTWCNTWINQCFVGDNNDISTPCCIGVESAAAKTTMVATKLVIVYGPAGVGKRALVRGSIPSR